MPFVFHKLLPLIVLPIGFVVFLLLLALIFKKRWLIAIAAVALYALSTNLVGERLIGFLENRYPAQTVANCPQADAIVVLGGVLRERLDGIEWGEAADRFIQGVALQQAGKAPRLVFTGAKLPWHVRTDTEGDELRQVAIARGVPPAAILVTGEVKTTADEAAAVTRLAREQGWKSIILVTSGFHMPRSMRLFRGAVPSVVPFPTDYRSRTGIRPTFTDFIPSAQALLTSDASIREYWGLLYYSFRR